ncbi:MAG: hypothetical protein VR68_11225 [Peptococcaceae bacterium BRH_c4a]|nr:MAG: hypothetical protein VR68_11225 [Peptococcaceae bacterium BRH_c4a]
MKRHSWYIILGICLILVSALFYLAHYAIFRDARHIFIYLMGDIAFLPIEVLLVSMIIHKVISHREKTVMREKLNMVIGAFFSEAGTDLITCLSTFSKEDKLAGRSQPDSRRGDLQGLNDFLFNKREFLLRLLENPTLLEHESFTELLQAVFHLTEELEYRPDLNNISEADHDHLTEDMSRAYTSLISQWIKYMNYLEGNYPYLFSLAQRINPLDSIY